MNKIISSCRASGRHEAWSRERSHQPRNPFLLNSSLKKQFEIIHLRRWQNFTTFKTHFTFLEIIAYFKKLTWVFLKSYIYFFTSGPTRFLKSHPGPTLPMVRALAWLKLKKTTTHKQLTPYVHVNLNICLLFVLLCFSRYLMFVLFILKLGTEGVCNTLRSSQPGFRDFALWKEQF